MTADPNTSLPAQTAIAVDALEPSVYRIADDGSIDKNTWRKTVLAPDSGHAFFYVRIGPNQQTPIHWHPSDTIYIVRKGEMIVPGEGSYFEGEVRWVAGGTPYGPESAGPDGCEFYYVSLGEFGSFDPQQVPPPARPSAP